MFRPPIALENRNRSIFILSPSFVSGFWTVTSSFTDVLSIHSQALNPSHIQHGFWSHCEYPA